MTDPTEALRAMATHLINSNPQSREELEEQYGQAWDTTELQEDFTVLQFAAPFVIVERKSDGAHGSLVFQHHPRFYYDFSIADESI